MTIEINYKTSPIADTKGPVTVTQNSYAAVMLATLQSAKKQAAVVSAQKTAMANADNELATYNNKLAGLNRIREVIQNPEIVSTIKPGDTVKDYLSKVSTIIELYSIGVFSKHYNPEYHEELKKILLNKQIHSYLRSLPKDPVDALKYIDEQVVKIKKTMPSDNAVETERVKLSEAIKKYNLIFSIGAKIAKSLFEVHNNQIKNMST